jgi:putative membrane protein
MNAFLAFEVFGFLAFAVILAREIYQRNWLRVFEIISCAVFGVILEVGDIYLGKAYTYNPAFLVKIAGVPLVIGLGWAVIIYCAMLLSDQYNIPWYLRPFMDALTAVILDLAIDPIAIRLAYWKWAIPPDQEFYGVPLENLIAWILVVLAFSFVIRFIRTLNIKRTWTKVLMVFSPVISYILLLFGMYATFFIVFLPYQINHLSARIILNSQPDLPVLYQPQVQLWKSAIFVIMLVELINIVIWAAVKYRRKYLWRFDLLSFAVMACLYAFFFIAIFVAGINSQIPILAVICLLSFLAYCLLHFLPYLLRPGKVYFFKGAERVLKKEEKLMEKIIEAEFR